MLKFKQVPEWTDSFNNQAIWQLAFRSFFLASSGFSIFCISAWLLLISGYLMMPAQSLSLIVWHAHEMIFGFAATVAVGFILTAVQTWTGKPSIKGWPVYSLLLLWLIVRVLLWINSDLSVLLAIGFQSIWWLTVIVIYSSIVIRKSNKRNYLFIPLLTVLAALDLCVLITGWLDLVTISLHLAKSAILLFTLLMGIVGGHVIPFFTVRGASTPPVTAVKWLEFSLLSVSIIGCGVFTLSILVSLPFTPAPLLITSGVLHLIRMLKWHTTKTLAVPLLWSLHIAYSFIGIGQIGLGLSYFSLGVSFSSAMHLITIGAIGLMIFSMMSRVSLGHTGRHLSVKPQIVLAFVLLILAAILRAFLPELGLVKSAWMLSAFFWVLAATLFFFTYWPVLIRPQL